MGAGTDECEVQVKGGLERVSAHVEKGIGLAEIGRKRGMDGGRPATRPDWHRARDGEVLLVSGALVVGVVVQLRCWLCAVCWKRQVAQALMVTMKGGVRECVNVPLPSQALFEECGAKNVLWGHAGPGKSHGVRQWLYKRSLMIPDHKALLLRENSKQLETTHLFDMKRELPRLDAKLVDETARFPNGAEIHCGHMADEGAVQRYLGTEYGAIVAEEGSLYPVNGQGASTLSELRTRARKDYVDVNGTKVSPKVRGADESRGPSAGYLCDMFVDHTPDYERYPRLAAGL